PGAGQTGLLDAPADRLEKMSGQAGRFGQAELARAAEILSEGLIQMRGTTSPRLLLELMCAQVLLPGASTGEKALAARMERLERRLEGLTSEEPVPRPGPAAAGGGAAGPGCCGQGCAGSGYPGSGYPGSGGRAGPRRAGPRRAGRAAGRHRYRDVASTVAGHPRGGEAGAPGRVAAAQRRFRGFA